MEAKKKICLVGHECGPYKGQGGIATYIELTAIGFAKLGLEVHVIYIYGSGVGSPLVKSWQIKNNPSNYKISIAVDEILEKIRPDYVECTDFLGLASYTLSKRALSGLNYDCTFITNHHTGIKEVWEWGTQLKFNESALPWMKCRYSAERAQSLLSDANFSTSHFLANYLDSNHIESYQVSPSIYEFDVNEKIGNNHYDKNILKIISLGRFELRKKQELLIKAVCELLAEGYNIETTLIGNSGGDLYTGKDYMEYCYSLIPDIYKSNFHFYDFLPYKTLQRKYVDYDLFIIPSPYENFPNTALEAIRYGVAVVGSKSSGVLDMIGNELSDYCFDKNSISDIKRVILKYNGLDCTGRAVLRQTQRASLHKLTCFEKTIRERFSLYEEIDRKKYIRNVAEDKVLIVYQNEDQFLSKIEYDGEMFYSSGSKWKSIIEKVDYIILVSEDYKDPMNKNYFPESGVILCSSSNEPYGTIFDIYSTKKTFSKIILNIKGICFSSSETLPEFIANVIVSMSDVIFFVEKGKGYKTKIVIGPEIKYAIDKLKLSYNGD